MCTIIKWYLHIETKYECISSFALMSNFSFIFLEINFVMKVIYIMK